MKKVILSIVVSLFALNVNAKKIKFAVDMATHTISPNGIHLIGDFQVLAGYGTMDWDPGTLSLTQEGTSTVYSVILNLPAFQKYEYKFVNGNQTYEAEFVPDASRVGYNFNDNRWIYLDSLTNDTSFVGAIKFGENAPAGKFLVRYLVDMSTAGVSSNGVHVGTSYHSGGFSATKAFMYSFGGNVHEVIDYVNNVSATHSYIFYNGNTLGNAETVPSGCANSGKRSIQVMNDTVLTSVCFSSCSACVTGIEFLSATSAGFKMYPNPSSDVVKISGATAKEANVTVLDQQGRILYNGSVSEDGINTSAFENGLYLVKISDNNITQTSRLVIIH